MRKLTTNKFSAEQQAQLQAVHRANMLASLERRMEAARSRGDAHLLELLEAERRQLS